MGWFLVAGGLIGSAFGVQIFKILRDIGQVDLLVKLCYVVFLGIIGSLMLWESIRALVRYSKKKHHIKIKRHNWVHRLPLKVRFRASNLYISCIPPFIIGVFVGFLAAIMGVGGGFILVPVMIYIIGMPTKIVIGTSLFQIIFVTGFTTLLHSTQNYSVDALLALILLIGGVVGAQIGTRLGVYLKAEQLRILLALLVLAVCVRLGLELLLEPEELFSLQEIIR